MAQLEYALVTKQELAAWMGLTYADLDPTTQQTPLEQITNGVTVWLEKYCDRRLKARTADITETFNGDGTNTYYVLNPPIVSITSITVEDAPTIDTTDDDEVRWDAETGCIYLLQQTFAAGFPLNCEIQYKGGFSTVPEDLWLAAASLMKFVWLQRDSNKELVRAISNLAGERVEYLTDIMTPDIKDVLDSYVLRRVT